MVPIGSDSDKNGLLDLVLPLCLYVLGNNSSLGLAFPEFKMRRLTSDFTSGLW